MDGMMNERKNRRKNDGRREITEDRAGERTDGRTDRFGKMEGKMNVIKQIYRCKQYDKSVEEWKDLTSKRQTGTSSS